MFHFLASRYSVFPVRLRGQNSMINPNTPSYLNPNWWWGETVRATACGFTSIAIFCRRFVRWPLLGTLQHRRQVTNVLRRHHQSLFLRQRHSRRIARQQASQVVERLAQLSQSSQLPFGGLTPTDSTQVVAPGRVCRSRRHFVGNNWTLSPDGRQLVGKGHS